MSSEARAHAGETLLHRIQLAGRDDPVTSDNTLVRSEPVIPATSAPVDELGYLRRRRSMRLRRSTQMDKKA